MMFRYKLRMVDDAHVIPLSEKWSAHLKLAVDFRDEHNACRNEATEAWKSALGDVVKCADLRID